MVTAPNPQQRLAWVLCHYRDCYCSGWPLWRGAGLYAMLAAYSPLSSSLSPSPLLVIRVAALAGSGAARQTPFLVSLCVLVVLSIVVVVFLLSNCRHFVINTNKESYFLNKN